MRLALRREVGCGQRDSGQTDPGVDGRHALFLDDLAEGAHTIRATAVDDAANKETATVDIEVVYDPPDVEIVYPADGTTVVAGEELYLVGDSTTGLFSLNDDQVGWHIVRNGAPIYAGGGHLATLPATMVQPGQYQVSFTGDDGHRETTPHMALLAQPKPPGDPSPTAEIIEPKSGTETASGETINFSRFAVDHEGEPISCTNFRWTATRSGEQIVLRRHPRSPRHTRHRLLKLHRRTRGCRRRSKTARLCRSKSARCKWLPSLGV